MKFSTPDDEKNIATHALMYGIEMMAGVEGMVGIGIIVMVKATYTRQVN
jgi:hypothetical protein